MSVAKHTQSGFLILCATVVFVFSLFLTKETLSRLTMSPDFYTYAFPDHVLSSYFSDALSLRYAKGIVTDFDRETGIIHVKVPTPKNEQPSKLRFQTTAETHFTHTFAEADPAGAFNNWEVRDMEQPLDTVLRTGAKASISYTITEDGHLRATYIDIWESQT